MKSTKSRRTEKSSDQIMRRLDTVKRGSEPFGPGGNTKFADNPMKRDFATRPRESERTTSTCGAQTRIGTACRRPPVVGRKRCRLHGGLSPGAPRGFKNGNFKTGDWTSDAIAEREWLKSLIKDFAKIGVVG
jgi:glucans biosynthesis protein